MTRGEPLIWISMYRLTTSRVKKLKRLITSEGMWILVENVADMGNIRLQKSNVCMKGKTTWTTLEYVGPSC
jgi:hypothetical protein